MNRRVLIAVTACLLATACSDDPEVSSASSDTSAAPTAASAPAAAPSTAPAATPESQKAVFAADTGRDEQAASGGPLSVTKVRLARQKGFDRVVFELDGKQPGEPGWTVQYVDEPRRDGSGDPVDVDGEATLVVLISGVGYPFDTGVEEVRAVELPSDLEVVADMELGAVFEGVYESFIGTSGKAPFRVFRLSDPARVVVDVRHG